METVLMYNITGIKAAQIRLLCAGQKILTRPVLDTELSMPLGALVGRPVRLSRKGESSFSDEMLVLADFNEGSLDRFLTTYRESGIEPVALKAVLTTHNQSWDSVSLHQELVRERMEFLQNRMGTGK